MPEVWKDIPGYEGRYQVSDLGRVKSLPRTRRGREDCVIRMPDRMLRPGVERSGHLAVNLRDGKRTKRVSVHQLVALAFIGPPPPGMEVCHCDNDPGNNRLENLRYDTHMNNMIDVAIAGNRGRQKLHVKDVLEIRDRLARGETGASLAREFQVTPAAISAIRRGRNFAWLQSENGGKKNDDPRYRP